MAPRSPKIAPRWSKIAPRWASWAKTCPCCCFAPALPLLLLWCCFAPALPLLCLCFAFALLLLRLCFCLRFAFVFPFPFEWGGSPRLCFKRCLNIASKFFKACFENALNSFTTALNYLESCFNIASKFFKMCFMQVTGLSKHI